MVRRILISSYKKLIWVITSTVISYCFVSAQAGCINVPSFNIDLTGNPNATWISPPVVRANQCCGLSNPERCVEFILTLDPSTEAISLGIISGAVPGGALFYQINCGPQNPINQPVCISGIGPHYVTFCKPGNNENVYEISAIAQPELSDDLTLNDGCAGEIFVSGLDPASINWTTVAPGALGAYNHYLSCTSGCSNVAVQSQGNPPPYIDVEVSGSAIGNCSGILFRDTVRISFVPALFVQIEPENPTVCFGEPNAIISAMASGGSEPYEFLWNTGETSQSISAGPGVYSVQLSDASGCPPVLATMEVFGFDQEIIANAGNDINMCVADISVNLNGQVQGASGGIWLGGSGSFSPNNQTLNASYTPSLSELDNGIAVLILETTQNGGCPAHRDTLTIFIYDYQEEDYNVVICQGDEFSVHGFTYNSTGAYNEVISNQFGCDSIIITVNLTVNDFVVENYNPIICQGEEFSVHGFTYNSTGVYSEVIQDQNGCDSIIISVNLTVNDFVVENYNPIICQGEEFSVHGFTYNSTGLYNEIIQDQNGCDSIVLSVNLTVNDFVVENYNPIICQGEQFSVHGFTYNSTGVYNEIIQDQNGCDSIVLSVNLTINDFVVENYNPIICQGDEFSVHGFTYSSTGVYNEVIQDQNGCDSIILSVNLTVNDFVVENYNPIICQGEQFSVHGFTYNSTGVYNEIIQNQNGCDSIVLSVNLTVNDFVVETYSPVICQGESFSVHGYTFNTSGFYQQILFHQSGCDSIVFSVELTVNPSHSTTENVTICSSEIHELPDGSLVNASGTYRVNLQNAFGCDSVIITILHVNMLGSYQPLNDLSLCESGNFSIQIEAENMVNFEWMMHVEELGWVSLANNPNFSGVNSNQLQFYLNTSLHNRDFVVHMTDECGNNYEESMHLNVFEPLPIDNKLDDLYFCDHEIETIRANYDGYDFEWNNGTLGQYITPDKPGEYIVSFTQFETGCRVMDTILIEIENCIEKCVVLAPTGFTPDGNGKNDIFRVVTSCDEGFSHFRLNVHNRWGELVYQTENPTDGWDGNYKGKTAEIGVYSFFVEYSKHYSQKHELIKGNVTLIR
jgi:gliding motility-associated-like protein